ncbi:MAG: aminotransferase class IV, partial [Planctomycetes bacterium]|nr:aminotransferase class IV [Planctomycetota bacterium]
MSEHGPSVVETKQPWIWQDGAITDPGSATIPVTDHGFLYGDSVYETIRTYGARPFALGSHLDRLDRSAAAIGLRIPMDRARLAEAIEQVIDARPERSEVGIRLMVTRGIGPIGLDISLCRTPRVIMIGWSISPGRHPMAEVGVSVVVSSIRRNPPNALNPHIKSGNFLNNILAYREAREQGAFEAILLTTENTVAEATTSNVFWIRDGEVRSSTDEGILLGVTRSHL